MKKIKPQVKEILTENAESRDNENLLVMLVYEMFYNFNKLYSVDIMFTLIDKKKIPSIQTIQRYSRQIQSENKELRGELWEKRQRQVKPVQKELGYNVKI
jgi:hypothetical protein